MTLQESIDKLHVNFVAAGVRDGSIVLLHSGLAEISELGINQITYANEVVKMLMELVGPNGTIMMPTDSIPNLYEFSYKRKVFEPDRMRSRRGIISEIFRLRPGVIRSRHPWCNASAWGKYADWLMRDHLLSVPFAMDRNSPWFKLTEIGAHIVYFGTTPANASQSSTVPENILGDDYPVGAFFDKSLTVMYKSTNGGIAEIPVRLHVHDWRKHELVAFFLHLDRTYGLYRFIGRGPEKLISCSAKMQFDVIMDSLAKGQPFIHVRYWS